MTKDLHNFNKLSKIEQEKIIVMSGFNEKQYDRDIKKTAKNLREASKLVTSLARQFMSFQGFEDAVNNNQKIVSLTTQWTRRQLIQKHAHKF